MNDGVIVGEQNNLEEAMRTQVWKTLMASIINAPSLGHIPNNCNYTEMFCHYDFFPCFCVNHPHLLAAVLTKHDTEQVQSENF